MNAGGTLLEVSDLTVTAAVMDRSLTLLHGVSLTVAPGEVVGLVGESGSGKTTLARSVLGLLESNITIAGGSISLRGEEIVSPAADRTVSIRGKHAGMVFQDASRSLNPLFTVRSQLAEVLRRHVPGIGKDQIAARSAQVLERMRIADTGRVLDSYPHQLSGGLRQRVAIGLAVVTEPALVVADECTTALDVTTQAEVVVLLRSLAADLGVGLLFVTHDLMLASDLCDRIAVMYQGEIVELGAVDTVLLHPEVDYTKRLLAAVPQWNGATSPHA
ncbi:ABC transporter ATP-binding protein [Nocardioides daejeonensis]|uniref:ABC transporter ATP-binding protein n=1 Tax=Nocardioides daejeonensis TaxID=1046556 RepID=UPI000D74D3DF|nr:ABC transporter ATP-binding protein [Nocardioides daejeonensis]